MTKGLLIGPMGPVCWEGETLEDFQKAVGGYIERINFADGSAYVNEDGKGLELPVNGFATYLCQLFSVGLHPGDCIVGNMLVVGPPDKNGYDMDISEETKQRIWNVANLGGGKKGKAKH